MSGKVRSDLPCAAEGCEGKRMSGTTRCHEHRYRRKPRARRDPDPWPKAAKPAKLPTTLVSWRPPVVVVKTREPRKAEPVGPIALVRPAEHPTVHVWRVERGWARQDDAGRDPGSEA